jgi:putative ABC transport system permease protein
MRLESLREGASLAIEQLRGNKFRSILTILGIVMGVASVMIMSALVAGIKEGISNEIEAAGPKNFYVARFDWNAARVVHDGPPWGNNPPIALEEPALLETLPTVQSAILGLDGQGEFVFENERVPNAQIWSRGAGWRDYQAGRFVAGHDFLPADVNAARPVVVLTKPLAEKLFGPLEPIGRTVRIGGQAFRVIGVFEMSSNIFSNLVKYGAFMPYSSAIKYLDLDDEMRLILVVTSSTATQQDAIDQVTARMRVLRRLRPADPNDFAIIKSEEVAKTFTKFTDTIFIVMIALSGVALMVGGVGVIAIMMIAVTERTREIGIRKALGATKREILWQFLFEAATVTFIGGVIGMLLGGAASLILTITTPLDAYVPLWAVGAALGMALVAGVLFGMWPAWRAARLDPVVALRYE